jgi:hypothetical protein
MGCKGAAMPDQKAYSSYYLASRDGLRQTVRLGLSTATNNEAE